jgi:hypothetical protein
MRSDFSLDIVLTFHHASLLRDIGLAEKSVTDHIGEGWAAPPTRHLPYVPCRLQPRGVIMQPRSRLMPDGVTLEEYEKPRITTDSTPHVYNMWYTLCYTSLACVMHYTGITHV